MSTATIHFYFTGGCLCLDFANTRSWRPSAAPNERLQSYADLLQWTAAAELLDASDLRALQKQAKAAPQAAEASLQRALLARELIYRIFQALAQGHSPRTADLDEFNVLLSEALSQLGVFRKQQQLHFNWPRPARYLDQAWWPAIRDAAEILGAAKPLPVRLCAADDCGWIFVDTSRNQARRWCDMRVCGNRDKVRRYQAQQREA